MTQSVETRPWSGRLRRGAPARSNAIALRLAGSILRDQLLNKLVEVNLWLLTHRIVTFAAVSISLSTCVVTIHWIATGGLHTIISEKNELEKLHDAHASGVEDGRSEYVPVLLSRLLRGEKGHLTKPKDERDVNHTWYYRKTKGNYVDGQDAFLYAELQVYRDQTIVKLEQWDIQNEAHASVLRNSNEQVGSQDPVQAFDSFAIFQIGRIAVIIVEALVVDHVVANTGSDRE